MMGDFDALTGRFAEVGAELNMVGTSFLDCAFEVHRCLGAGHLEWSYEEALDFEMKLRDVLFERQKSIHLDYKGHDVGESRVDFLIAGRVLVELKAVEKLLPVHKAQLMAYMRILGVASVI